MDIKDILDSLGLDLTNPEVKRGVADAIEAILSSRIPPNLSGGAGGGGGEEIEVELDPDLIQPSIKHNSTAQDTEDIEIEDEDEILDKIKHNQSDDVDGNSQGSDSSAQNNSTSQNSDSSSSSGSAGDSDGDAEGSNDDGGDDVDTSSDTSQNHKNTTDSSTSKNAEDAEDTENIEDELDEPGEPAADSESDIGAEETTTASDDNSEDSDAINDEEELLDDENTEEVDSEDALDDSEASSFADEETGETENSEENLEEPGDSSEDLLDDDLLDDELKDTFDDTDKQTKQKARKIKRERTLLAAKKTLERAKAAKAAPALIRELENSIAALESLTEAVTKNLYDISDDEFNMMVNRVFDAMEAIGDTGLTYTTEKERELQAQEIKTDLASDATRRELSAEDVAQIRAETQAVKAREKEKEKYKPRARGSFKNFQEFLKSLYRAIALQVQTNEIQDDSWSAINRRYSGTSILQPGKRVNELPDSKIPIIDFYFDCSGSWDNSDIQIGKKAAQALAEMEDKGQIKINIYYFSDNVHTDYESARDEGGTTAWNKIVKNVIATQATNVIIMTDSDMEGIWCSWRDHENNPLSYTVPGYVWYLWKNGDNAPRLPRDLKGRGGVQQFSFSHSDL